MGFGEGLKAILGNLIQRGYECHLGLRGTHKLWSFSMSSFLPGWGVLTPTKTTQWLYEDT